MKTCHLFWTILLFCQVCLCKPCHPGVLRGRKSLHESCHLDWVIFFIKAFPVTSKLSLLSVLWLNSHKTPFFFFSFCNYFVKLLPVASLTMFMSMKTTTVQSYCGLHFSKAFSSWALNCNMKWMTVFFVLTFIIYKFYFNNVVKVESANFVLVMLRCHSKISLLLIQWVWPHFISHKLNTMEAYGWYEIWSDCCGHGIVPYLWLHHTTIPFVNKICALYNDTS